MADDAPFIELALEHDVVSLLKDGAQAYPAMLAAIRGARATICFETYILRDDSTGRRFAEALCERARAGVEVLVLYDAWGSSLSEDFLRELSDAGVQARPFRPARFKGSFGRMLAHFRKRNHRKSLVVDGSIGFTGGLNVCDDYASEEDGGKRWRDTHVRIAGPSAQELERLFLSTWKKTPGPPPAWSKFSRGRQGDNSKLRIIGNDFATNRKHIRKAYVEAFGRSKRRICLTQAYFLPPSRVLRALLNAARRGVAVKLILAGSTDVRVLLHAARGLYPKLLKAGVEVYEWQGRVLHAKTAVVDREWVTIGSSNLDALSLRQNLEVNAVIESSEFGEAAERLFLEDLQFAERVTLERVKGYGLLERMVQWVAMRLRHWL